MVYPSQYGTPKRLSEINKRQGITIKERDHPVGVWQMNIRGKKESINVNDGLSTNNGEVAVDWALAVWDIIAFRTGYCIHIESGRLQWELLEYIQPAGTYAVYPSELRDTHKIKTIVDFFRERI